MLLLYYSSMVCRDDRPWRCWISAYFSLIRPLGLTLMWRDGPVPAKVDHACNVTCWIDVRKKQNALDWFGFQWRLTFRVARCSCVSICFVSLFSSCILIIGPQVSKVHIHIKRHLDHFLVKYGFYNRTGCSAPDCASNKNPVLIAVGPPSLARVYREFP